MCPYPEAFQAVDLQLADWLQGKKIETAAWSTQEWLHFLRGLPRELGAARMRRLDSAWHLTESGNDEILDQWLLMAIRNHYEPAYPRLEEFLMTVGRRKYVKPLYDALDLKRASAIYEQGAAHVSPDYASDSRRADRGEEEVSGNGSPLTERHSLEWMPAACRFTLILSRAAR